MSTLDGKSPPRDTTHVNAGIGDLREQQQIHIDAINKLEDKIEKKEAELKARIEQWHADEEWEALNDRQRKTIGKLESEIEKLKEKLEKEEAGRDEIRNLILQGTFHTLTFPHPPQSPLLLLSLTTSNITSLYPHPLPPIPIHPHHTFLRN
eukprot:TRINITY_DN310_c0_g1_i4.p1 TRINITY_DN310_c0_g1~~TRINITY_DN310_c0_g1_i4.p1  ORF type:complete len:151 (-),score=45.64 TRINITY_DN310_c0_g1_i4:216-668(-)